MSVHSFENSRLNFQLHGLKKYRYIKRFWNNYVLTVDRDAVAQYLRNEVGISAEAYHSRLEPHEKIDIENKLLNNEIKVVIATTALGMGFDKPDLGFLIHLGIPKTLTDYYQQIGRAGRKLENADCVLISLPDDDDINEYFIMNKVPEQPTSDLVLSLIPTLRRNRFKKIDLSKIDATRYKIKKIAERLELDEYIKENDNGTFSKIKDEATYNTMSVQPLLTQARNQYQEVKFLESDQCLMGILLNILTKKLKMNLIAINAQAVLILQCLLSQIEVILILFLKFMNLRKIMCRKV